MEQLLLPKETKQSKQSNKLYLEAQKENWSVSTNNPGESMSDARATTPFTNLALCCLDAEANFQFHSGVSLLTADSLEEVLPVILGTVNTANNSATSCRRHASGRKIGEQLCQ